MRETDTNAHTDMEADTETHLQTRIHRDTRALTYGQTQIDTQLGTDEGHIQVKSNATFSHIRSHSATFE